MPLKRLGAAIVLAFLTLGVFAAAQTAAEPTLAPPAADAQSAREVELPPAEQLNLAQQYMARIDQAATTVRSMLEQARAARDVVKTLCLNDKLNQIDVASRSARDRLASLQSAAAANDRDRARHEFVIIQVLRDRIAELVKEANQCIGEEAGFIGESQVTLDIDRNIPDNNPDQLGFDPTVISEPPVVSSPMM